MEFKMLDLSAIFHNLFEYRLQKAAFTLAEVIITIGIIGVVAAMTLPTIQNHFKVKILESQFKTADSIITQALKNTASELGYEDLKDLNLKYYVNSFDDNGGEPRRNQKAINEAWGKQFKNAKPINPLPEIYHKGVKTHSILGYEMPDPTTVYSGGYILPNGMFVSRIGYGIYSSPPTCLHFYFDTNGPYKGPNKFGHDIFHYYSIQYRAGCNPVRGISSREEGCYWYAHTILTLQKFNIEILAKYGLQYPQTNPIPITTGIYCLKKKITGKGNKELIVKLLMYFLILNIPMLLKIHL